MITTITEWETCFDANGRGNQQLRMTDGSTCTSDVTAGFLDNGQLRILDQGNVSCDNNTFIYERQMTCDLDQNNRAQCVSRQASRGSGGSSVRLRRK